MVYKRISSKHHGTWQCVPGSGWIPSTPVRPGNSNGCRLISDTVVWTCPHGNPRDTGPRFLFLVLSRHTLSCLHQWQTWCFCNWYNDVTSLTTDAPCGTGWCRGKHTWPYRHCPPPKTHPPHASARVWEPPPRSLSPSVFLIAADGQRPPVVPQGFIFPEMENSYSAHCRENQVETKALESCPFQLVFFCGTTALPMSGMSTVKGNLPVTTPCAPSQWLVCNPLASFFIGPTLWFPD